MLSNPIKLIIWDLDDTFWTGTLAEGGVTVPTRNVDLVITLAKRGIISSICSKNNFDDARAVLERHGVWSYFVFPRIEFAPKGAAIALLIEQMALRPDNVLFIDDNRLNLEEARHYAPSLMVAHPDDILPTLLDLPQATGKDDSALTRLQQYKQLEKKAEDFTTSKLANDDFLRQCDISVAIDVDVEKHIDRVIELINRSNQLNFTKLRIEGPAAREKFMKALRSFGIQAGIVRVRDKYGDYGIVGFFMARRNAARYFLQHFVFSCRTMNMGIEQYVYELLGEPEIEVVPPVANGLKIFAKIDWIRAGEEQSETVTKASDAKLLLLGSCELMQMASYCSTNRAEYVNLVRNDLMVRYDDFGFLLSPREAIASSTALPVLPCWSKEDVARFDVDIGDARVVIVSLWEALRGDYMVVDGTILVRLLPTHIPYLAEQLRDKRMLSRYTFIRTNAKQKAALLARSLAQVVRLSPNAQARFLLGVKTEGAHEMRTLYNSLGLKLCAPGSGIRFISTDELVPETELIKGNHLTRKAYFDVATEILRLVGENEMDRSTSASLNATAVTGFTDLVRDVVVMKFSDLVSRYADSQEADAARIQKRRAGFGPVNLPLASPRPVEPTMIK